MVEGARQPAPLFGRSHQTPGGHLRRSRNRWTATYTGVASAAAAAALAVHERPMSITAYCCEPCHPPFHTAACQKTPSAPQKPCWECEVVQLTSDLGVILSDIVMLSRAAYFRLGCDFSVIL